jgi:hypothetical protein
MDLSPDELETINSLLAQEAMRRKSASAGLLRVLVDGAQRAEITPTSETARFNVDENAELIEVYDTDERGSLLLATHLLNPSDKAQHLAITLEGGQTINFNVDPIADASGIPAGANLTVTFTDELPHAGARKARSFWASVFDRSEPAATLFTTWWKPAAVFGMLLLLLAGAWLFWRRPQNEPRIAQIPSTPSPAAATPAVSPSNSEKANRDEERPPNGPGSNPPQNKSRPARNETLVARSFLPVTGGTEDDNATRGENRNPSGKTLREIRRVYLQATSDNDVTRKFLNELQARLGKGTITTSDADNADAALKISARRAVAESDNRVIVIVRAVNASGRVVWPDSRRRGSWKYAGESGFVAERIATDLTKAAR